MIKAVNVANQKSKERLEKVTAKIVKNDKGEDVEVEPETKLCPFCLTEIKYKATKCPHCTSDLTKAE